MFRSIARHRIPLGIAPCSEGPEKPAPAGPKVLAIVAHPDDEYVFAATVWRIVRELDGVADQVIVSDGAGGNRYAAPARYIYGVELNGDDASSRAWLTAIRREETRSAGEILGLRRQYFLDQPDSGYTLDGESTVHELWDAAAVTRSIDRLLAHEAYVFVLLLLPASDAHGHHQAAAVLALDCIARMPADERPVVLGVETVNAGTQRRFISHPRHPITRVLADAPVYDLDRRAAFAGDPALSYHLVVNWVIAEHKSQGLFQAEAGRFDIERFRIFAAGHPHSRQRASALFRSLAANQQSTGAAALARS